MSASRKRGERGRPPHDSPADDAALWDKVAATAKPLKGSKRAVAPQPKPNPAPTEDSAPSKNSRAAPPPPPAPPKQRALEAGAIVDVDRRTADRLRRGQMAIDGRIDLHGMTHDDAHAALARFVAASRAAGRRCVLVITGKGRANPEGGGVLKQAVPRWLNEPALRAQILAFVAAQPRDGGTGALYVLLKRVRA